MLVSHFSYEKLSMLKKNPIFVLSSVFLFEIAVHFLNVTDKG